MRIVVFLKEVPDVKVSYEPSFGGTRDAWNVSMVDPDDAAALGTALEIRGLSHEVRVTAVLMGPPSGDRFLREALALGCDDAIRVWDEDLYVHSRAKSLILARVARILGFDLLLAGARSQDTASDQLGVLLSANLDIPCVTRVVALSFGHGRVLATKRLSGGYLEEAQAPTPVIITMDGAEKPMPYAAFPKLVEAAERRIPRLDLSDIGLPRAVVAEAEAAAAFGQPVFPVPPLTPIGAPDSSRPGYERRERLREGVLVKREGKTMTGDDDALVEKIFRYLSQEGWLAHLGPKGERS